MKPRPTAPKDQRGQKLGPQEHTPTRASETPTRTIYVRDPDRTSTGYATHAAASIHADKIIPVGPGGTRDRDDMRVRVSYRPRTGLFDVVVKVAKRVPIEEPKAIGE